MQSSGEVNLLHPESVHSGKNTELEPSIHADAAIGKSLDSLDLGFL